jgi:ribosome-associated protein
MPILTCDPSRRSLTLSLVNFSSGWEVAHGDTECEPVRVSMFIPVDLPPSTLVLGGGPLTSATARPEQTLTSRTTLEHASLCARVAAENKARDVAVLDMRGLTPLFDYFVIATGASRRQIHTIAEEIDAAMHAEGERRLGIEGYEASKWVVQDYGDIVVHIFDPNTRAYYGLEDLWADAVRVDWERY